ncbi:endoglucanase 3 [Ancistrocladus abbreviatus]
MPENLRKPLAAAVRSIQWSYAIFWSFSPTEPGVLEWGEGYYNGDIKTIKTIQAMELNDDQIGMQRSEQLRELYESLLAGESSPQARRPSAALCPEDLTNSEWYYLVCMSFVFNPGQGLPGRAFITGQPIWLCNAPYSDSKAFNRSLLAKLLARLNQQLIVYIVFCFLCFTWDHHYNWLPQSASIQTVACFPFLGGVVELGVTELVSEDLSIIQHLKTYISEYPILSMMPNSITHLNDNILDAALTPLVQGEQLESPNNILNSFRPIQQGDNTFIVEGINGEASQAPSWQLTGNCAHTSMTSSDCISQSLLITESVVLTPKAKNSHEIPDCENTGIEAELQGDHLHYQNLLSSLIKTSHQLSLGPSFRKCIRESGFLRWRKDSITASQKPEDQTSQKMLKKILFEVPRMHGGCLLQPIEGQAQEDVLWRPEIDEPNMKHVIAERRRRGKVKEKISALKSLVPSTSKVDKVSILDNTIAYLKELEQRVKELESYQEMTENEARENRKPEDMVESTSHIYRHKKKIGGSKRKASDRDEARQEISHASLIDSIHDSVSINRVKNDILIEMRCPWRECLLIDIINTLNTLRLDSHSVKSSTLDGTVSITIRSKIKGSTGLTAGIIRQALQRVIQK